MPIALAPLILASCPTMEPTGPVAAATATVSPCCGLPIASKPAYAVKPGIPSTPTAVGEDEVTGHEIGVPGFDDFTDSAALHDIADLDRGRIRLCGAHASAHVRVERQVDGAQQHFAFGGCRDVDRLDLEVRGGGFAFGSRREQDAGVLIISGGIHRSPSLDWLHAQH